MRVEGEISYVLADHLGSASVTLDASGNVQGEMRYFAYGAMRDASGYAGTDRLFTGQREVGETGLYHYGARFYSPLIRRFISADTILPQPGEPQGFNRYAYVYNNPLKYADADGHFPFLLGLVGGLIGGAIYGYGRQVARNLDQGMGLGEALTTNIDPVEVGCFTAAGGVIGSGVWLGAAIGSAVLGSEAVTNLVGRAVVWTMDHVIATKAIKAVGEEAIEATLTGTSFDPVMVGLDFISEAGDDILAAARGRYHGVAYEMELDPADYGASRSTHNRRANAALQEAAQSDARFASDLEPHIPDVTQAADYGNGTPPGFRWHHAAGPDDARGVRMQLVPGVQHSPGSPWWGTLHPGGRGGFARLASYRPE
jgi:RHS repeat-associated protein